jgi:DNA-directed RNA polymerase specialized sigma subunit
VRPHDQPAVQVVDQWLRSYAESGDRWLRERIIPAYLGMADRIANRYVHSQGVALEDLQQVAGPEGVGRARLPDTDELTVRLGRSPTVQKLVDHLGACPQQVVEAIGAAQRDPRCRWTSRSQPRSYPKVR